MEMTGVIRQNSSSFRAMLNSNTSILSVRKPADVIISHRTQLLAGTANRKLIMKPGALRVESLQGKPVSDKVAFSIIGTFWERCK